MSIAFTLAMTAGSGVPTLFLYALVARARTPARPPTNVPGERKQRVFDVFERNGIKKALSNSHTLDFWIGAIYCLLFYFAAPMLIWRYGIVKSLSFVGVPLAGALAISLALGFDGRWGAMLFGIPLRLAVGLLIMSRSSLIRINSMLAAGWTHVGSCRTNTAATAIDAFFPSPPEQRRWYKTPWVYARRSN